MLPVKEKQLMETTITKKAVFEQLSRDLDKHY